MVAVEIMNENVSRFMVWITLWMATREQRSANNFIDKYKFILQTQECVIAFLILIGIFIYSYNFFFASFTHDGEKYLWLTGLDLEI